MTLEEYTILAEENSSKAYFEWTELSDGSWLVDWTFKTGGGSRHFCKHLKDSIWIVDEISRADANEIYFSQEESSR